MQNDKLHPQANVAASLSVSGAMPAESVRAKGVFHAQCFDKDGKLKWEDWARNLVTDVGAKLMLDTILAGSTFTAATYMGLKGTGTALVTETQASHAAWLEVGATNAPAYTAPRKTVSWNAASGTGAGSRSKTPTAAQSFVFTSGGTVAGCFMNINGTSAIDNTTGTLFSAGDFSGGSKTVANTDTLNVSYTLSA
jgi:hypothetical protein